MDAKRLHADEEERKSEVLTGRADVATPTHTTQHLACGVVKRSAQQPEADNTGTLTGSSAPHPRTCLCSGMACGGSKRTWHKTW
eukprot:573958-Rhodomonas_salina.1